MYLITTLTYDDLSQLLKNKKLSTNNVGLVASQVEGNTEEFEEVISEYFKTKLGYNNFVLGLVGQINDKNIDTLCKLDKDMLNGKLAIELKIADGDAISIPLKSLIDVGEYISYGATDEDIMEQLDYAISTVDGNEPSIVCIPYIKDKSAERLTSLTANIVVDNIKFVYIHNKGRNEDYI